MAIGDARWIGCGVWSGLAGQSEIALGNVVGSSIFNVLVILEISAIIVPLRVAAYVTRIAETFRRGS